MPASSGENAEGKAFGCFEKQRMVLPMWREKEPGPEKPQWKHLRRYFTFGYQVIPPTAGPVPGTKVPTLKLKPCASSSVVDPWVFRCRIAAMASGIILTIALVTIVILVEMNWKWNSV
jgi:hypothetical protein